MTNERVYIAGHTGMVGAALLRKLILTGIPQKNILTRTREQLDLLSQQEVLRFLFEERPNQVYIAAAKVGGIQANNTKPAEFIYQNLVIQINLIHASFIAGVKKLIFLGSSCIYPRQSRQPISEEQLLSGQLEPTNEPYAIAKIAGIKLCESYNRQYGATHGIDYRSLMPTNLYGPGDTYDLESSHVIPALIRRFHEAKVQKIENVTLWGTGTARREFLYVEDLAEACVFVMNLDSNSYKSQTEPMRSHLNVGWGDDLTIAQLADLIADAVGYKGKINFDSKNPDGTPRKLLQTNRLQELGWKPKVQLKDGLKRTYVDYLESVSQ